MNKFQKVKKNSASENDIDIQSNSSSNHVMNSTFQFVCPIPEIGKIQMDNNNQNIYVMVFMSDNSIYQKYKTSHSFEIISSSNISETYNFFSYYLHYQLPKTIQPFFKYDSDLESEINNNQKEYVIIGWIVRSGEIIGILYVQMYNHVYQNYNILIIEDCPFICFLGSLTTTFFGLFLNNIKIVESIKILDTLE